MVRGWGAAETVGKAAGKKESNAKAAQLKLAARDAKTFGLTRLRLRFWGGGKAAAEPPHARSSWRVKRDGGGSLGAAGADDADGFG
jgi:hypothetical protein